MHKSKSLGHNSITILKSLMFLFLKYSAQPKEQPVCEEPVNHQQQTSENHSPKNHQFKARTPSIDSGNVADFDTYSKYEKMRSSLETKHEYVNTQHPRSDSIGKHDPTKASSLRRLFHLFYCQMIRSNHLSAS